MHCFTLVLLFLMATLSLQACPNGWRQSTVDLTKCYLVVVSRKIWFEAGAYCASAASNAFLTSVNSAYETYSVNAIVTDTPSISACDQMWIGANDFDQNGQFVWTDNKPFHYTNWALGQPDLSNQCVSSQARTTGKWKTEPCGTENCFICETYVGSSGSTTTLPTTILTTPHGAMTDCWDWLHYGGATTDGIYPINPSGSSSFNVYCDMTTNGGGWTVFQKRTDGNLTFWNKTWSEYKSGFNNGLERNHWLGSDNLHLLSTKDASVTLRIDLRGDRCQNFALKKCRKEPLPNGYWWGEYPQFSIGDGTSSYRLHTGIINAGNLTLPDNDARDGFSYHNDAMFSTIDQDHSQVSCETAYNAGGWWLKSCMSSALNGKYMPSDQSDGLYCLIHYEDFYEIVPVSTEMKLRKN